MIVITLFRRWRMVRNVRAVARIRDLSNDAKVKDACTELLQVLVR